MEESHFSRIDRLNRYFQSARARLLFPILRALTSLGLSGNKLTNGRLILGIIFWAWFPYDPRGASILLLITLLLDAVDGALARYQEKTSDRGKFLDVFTDHAVYAAMVLRMIGMRVSAEALVFNMFIVGAAYFLAALYKGEGKSTDWIIKAYPQLAYVRAFMVIGFLVTVWSRFDISAACAALTNGVAAVVAIYYWAELQRRWKKIHA